VSIRSTNDIPKEKAGRRMSPLPAPLLQSSEKHPLP
jgi:hypothetical protein